MCTTLALASCPCSGGEGGTNPFLVLAVVAATWWLGSMLVSAWRKRGATPMGKVGKIAVIVVVAAVVVAVIALKRGQPRSANPGPGEGAAGSPSAVGTDDVATKQPAAVQPRTGIPRLVDLGAGKCIPCKMMAPILEELKEEYKGKLDVVFIDVWKDQSAGARYGIRVIPTQIFYDASGKERFRHEGFFSKEDILSKWKELGIDLEQGGTDASAK